MRELYNSKLSDGVLDAECAALFIWLNKHCFNGLYRVNSSGVFNVPYNGCDKNIYFDEQSIMEISNYFNTSEIYITCGDFEDACNCVKSDDFVYFDSPYVAESDTANFTDYTDTGFSTFDHERLCKLYKHLDSIGAYVMLSNNDVPYVRDLYSGFNIESVCARRSVNRNGSKRTGKEIIVTNYDHRSQHRLF